MANEEHQTWERLAMAGSYLLDDNETRIACACLQCVEIGDVLGSFFDGVLVIRIEKVKGQLGEVQVHVEKHFLAKELIASNLFGGVGLNNQRISDG